MHRRFFRTFSRGKGALVLYQRDDDPLRDVLLSHHANAGFLEKFSIGTIQFSLGGPRGPHRIHPMQCKPFAKGKCSSPNVTMSRGGRTKSNALANTNQMGICRLCPQCMAPWSQARPDTTQEEDATKGQELQTLQPFIMRIVSPSWGFDARRSRFLNNHLGFRLRSRTAKPERCRFGLFLRCKQSVLAQIPQEPET